MGTITINDHEYYIYKKLNHANKTYLFCINTSNEHEYTILEEIKENDETYYESVNNEDLAKHLIMLFNAN